jgi:hypothetical protein
MSLSIDGGLGSIGKNTKVKIKTITLSCYIDLLYKKRQEKNKVPLRSF